MALKEHPDYSFEKERLASTIKYITDAIEENVKNSDNLRTDTKEAFIEYDYRDGNASYDRISLNAALYDIVKNKHIGLLHSRSKPYFCRIDFKPDDSIDAKKLYIGKMSLSGENIENPLIIDWRAPIASVYYDGRLGNVTYNAPDGIQSGELFLKRQYTINNGELEDIMDVDITTTDAFLQAALGENKDNRLKDIVSTIQAEQNEIIRADISNPLIVQGAAGSGKTTIALHRIAYLIYTYEKSFDPDNFLIIAPNGLFLTYISEVLPELGVAKVRQSTFIDLAYKLLGIKHKLVNPDEKLTRLIGHNKENSDILALLREVSQFKGSLAFRDMLENYAAALEQAFIPEQDFMLNNEILYTAAEIRKFFMVDFKYLPPYKRVAELRKALRNKLKRERATIILRTENYYDRQIQHMRDTIWPSEERKEKIVALIDERDDNVASIKRLAKTAVSKYLSLLPKKDVSYYYKELMIRPDECIKYYGSELDEKFATSLCEYNAELLNRNTIELEDLTALLFLKYRIYGLDEKMTIKYIVIDEAQDFSLFQLNTLKEIFQTQMFTILGDLAQGIHSYRGISDWNDVIKKVFTSGRCRYLTLEKSYRTTMEIMNMANEILLASKITGLVPAQPVVRHGAKPGVYRCALKAIFIELLIHKIQTLQEEYKTIAVICKTNHDCDIIKKRLGENVKVKQLGAKDMSYEGGTVIVPSYLAKGLEFDAVLICTYDEDYYAQELDFKLLYVAMTRALHSMDVICTQKNMLLLNTIDQERYIAHSC